MAPFDGFRPAPELMEDAAILLIVGGLLMLGLVVLLVVLRAVFPVGRPVDGDRVSGRLDRALVRTPSLPPAPATAPRSVPLLGDRLGEGRRAARRIQARTLDDVFDEIANNGWGQARALRLMQNRAVVRYYACSECAPTGPATNGGCSFQAGFLQEALGRLYDEPLRVQETSCRRRGDPTCEFEVAA